MATKVKYILEVQKPGGDRKRAILPFVTEISLDRNHAVTSIWTLGAKPFHQYTGVRGQKLSIRGRSGVATRFDTDGITSVASADMSGPALFRKIESFIENYENDTAVAQRQFQKPPKMVFRALWENKSLLVEPGTFGWDRSSSTSRFSYEYQLALESYGKAANDRDTGVLSFLSGAFEIANAVTAAINTASVAVARVAELLEDSRREMDTFREPLRAVGRLARQTSRLSRAVDSLAQWPKAFMQDFWNTSDACVEAVFDGWAALPFFDRQEARSVMIDALGGVSEARRKTQTALGLNFIRLDGDESSFEQQLSTSSSALSATGRLPGGFAVRNGQLAQVYVVRAGDTLQSIAGRQLGDRSRWTEIAEMNGMSGADVSPDGAPLIGGAILLVPAPDGADITGLNPSDLYGTDLLITDDGDLAILGDNQDVQLRRGSDNLRQGLRLRLLTVQGGNATFPDHGLPQTIGEAGTTERVAEVAVEAQDQFIADQRIEEVTDIVVDDQGDRIIVEAVLKPVVGKAFDVTVPFPTAG